MLPFTDRRDAGRQLAARLTESAFHSPVVIALPRGGVPVGQEVARTLGAPLDILVARKVGAPGNPELAIGAVAPGVIRVDPSAGVFGAGPEYLERTVARAQEEIKRREAAYRGRRPMAEVTARTVILVDDGLATGETMAAAVESLRRLAPARIVVAVPVGAPDSIERLEALADEVTCLHAPRWFRAVGEAYLDFRQTSDEEVIRILASQAAG